MSNYVNVAPQAYEWGWLPSYHIGLSQNEEIVSLQSNRRPYLRHYKVMRSAPLVPVKGLEGIVCCSECTQEYPASLAEKWDYCPTCGVAIENNEEQESE